MFRAIMGGWIQATKYIGGNGLDISRKADAGKGT